jgi:predicted cupin superfamily sugar epimerase
MKKFKDKDVAELIAELNLAPHDEGGWFRETYRSAETIDCPDREGRARSLMTTIHYLLDKRRPLTALHANRSDIVHFHEGGGAFLYLLLWPDGRLDETVIGPGHDRQLTVPGGVWKAAELVEGDWGLIGEAVSPGFDYRDRTLAESEDIARRFPQHVGRLTPFFRRAGA